VAVRLLEVEQRQAVRQVRRDRLLQQHVVPVGTDRTAHLKVRGVRRADEDHVAQAGHRDEVLHAGEHSLRRNAVPALERRTPPHIRLDHAAQREPRVVRRDQLGEHPVAPGARADDDDVDHPASVAGASSPAAVASTPSTRRAARVPARVNHAASPPPASSAPPSTGRPKRRCPVPNISANTAALPAHQASAIQRAARRDVTPPIPAHQPGGRTRSKKRWRWSRGTGGVTNVATSDAVVASATITTSRYSSRASGYSAYSTTAAMTATVMPAISVHAFTRHHSQRRIAGRPSPAPSAMKNRHAFSMLVIWLAIPTASNESPTTVSRLATTSSRCPACGLRKRRYTSLTR